MLFMAMLPIQRSVESGEKVLCWLICQPAPPALRSSYQRMPAISVPVASTVWFITIV